MGRKRLQIGRRILGLVIRKILIYQEILLWVAECFLMEKSSLLPISPHCLGRMETISIDYQTIV